MLKNLRNYSGYVKEGECFKDNEYSMDPMDSKYWVGNGRAFFNYLITLWVNTRKLNENHQELVKDLNKIMNDEY